MLLLPSPLTSRRVTEYQNDCLVQRSLFCLLVGIILACPGCIIISEISVTTPAGLVCSCKTFRNCYDEALTLTHTPTDPTDDIT